MSDSATPIKTVLKNPSLRLVAGKITLRGNVYGHPESEDGTFFETPPLIAMDLANHTASTKGLVYHYEGDLLK